VDVPDPGLRAEVSALFRAVEEERRARAENHDMLAGYLSSLQRRHAEEQSRWACSMAAVQKDITRLEQEVRENSRAKSPERGVREVVVEVLEERERQLRYQCIDIRSLATRVGCCEQTLQATARRSSWEDSWTRRPIGVDRQLVVQNLGIRVDQHDVMLRDLQDVVQSTVVGKTGRQDEGDSGTAARGEEGRQEKPDKPAPAHGAAEGDKVREHDYLATTPVDSKGWGRTPKTTPEGTCSTQCSELSAPRRTFQDAQSSTDTPQHGAEDSSPVVQQVEEIAAASTKQAEAISDLVEVVRQLGVGSAALEQDASRVARQLQGLRSRVSALESASEKSADVRQRSSGGSPEQIMRGRTTQPAQAASSMTSPGQLPKQVSPQRLRQVQVPEHGLLRSASHSGASGTAKKRAGSQSPHSARFEELRGLISKTTAASADGWSGLAAMLTALAEARPEHRLVSDVRVVAGLHQRMAGLESAVSSSLAKLDELRGLPSRLLACEEVLQGGIPERLGVCESTVHGIPDRLRACEVGLRDLDEWRVGAADVLAGVKAAFQVLSADSIVALSSVDDEDGAVEHFVSSLSSV